MRQLANSFYFKLHIFVLGGCGAEARYNKKCTMFNFLSTTKLTTHGSSTSLSELDQVASLKEALEGLDALLNDDLNS